MVKIKIITCPDWGARKPKAGLQTVPAAKRIIFHHTAGHHPEIENPSQQSRAESERYARDIQAFHMSQGWNDSGHNFLVCRNGLILQGRWLTVSTIQANHMVRSAHCPGQNDQIGIEHEHLGNEAMTKQQRDSSARLMAWIADKYGLKKVLSVDPHSKHFATACPANLKADIPGIVKLAQEILVSESDQFKV
jgi:N-acetylmuramoyl-L-alanine amidase